MAENNFIMRQNNIYDFVIIGSGFGGSVSAMRLTEKGYSVLILEKGKRYQDKDFAKTNWQFWKYLWLPIVRAHGILQVSILKGVMVLHGAGVGGGSLGYANVLEVPSDETCNLVLTAGQTSRRGRIRVVAIRREGREAPHQLSGELRRADGFSLRYAFDDLDQIFE